MNNKPLIIKQSDLDEIAGQVSRYSLAVLLSAFQEIDQGRPIQITENGAVRTELKSCDELSSYILSKIQAVPEDSPLLIPRKLATGQQPASPDQGTENL